MNISQKAIDFIIQQEVTSESYYNKKLSRPTYAGGDSGITIGIGYDLGYNTKEEIANDWSKHLDAETLKLLQSCSGFKGEKCLPYLSNKVKAISISYESAVKVFTEISLPKFWAKTKAIYPGVENLNADTQGALTSMVFNRGNSLSGPRRVNMKNIVDLVAKADYKGIANEIEKSKQLWIGKGLDGLVNRREQEAVMILESIV